MNFGLLSRDLEQSLLVSGFDPQDTLEREIVCAFIGVSDSIVTATGVPQVSTRPFEKTLPDECFAQQKLYILFVPVSRWQRL